MFCAKKSLVVLAALGTLFFLAAPAVADWDPPGDRNTKWVQYPDISPNGLDVRVTSPLILADDWKCNDPRPVTDIHLWGSWKYDGIPPAADYPNVVVQIWSDQPATAVDYSRPLECIREVKNYEWTARLYDQLPGGEGEGWYDPREPGYLQDNDHYVMQLNMYLDDPFRQVEGEIYWLVIQAQFPEASDYQLGWKTSIDHWNDDAVWAQGVLDGSGVQYEWNELRYPDGHLYQGESIDLSFVITVPEPGTLALLATALLGLLLFAWRRRK